MRRLLAWGKAGLGRLVREDLLHELQDRALLTLALFALLLPLVWVMQPLLYGIERAFDDHPGEALFCTVTQAFGCIAWLLLPLRAALRLYVEIETHALETNLSVSRTPSQFVSGRLQSCAVQSLLALGFIAPFAIAACVLGGVAPMLVLRALILVSVVGVAQTAAALLATSTRVAVPHLGPMPFIFLMLLLVCGGLLGIGSLEAVLRYGGSAEISWAALVFVLLAIFLLRLCADLLTPPAERSYLRAKLLSVLLCAALMAPWFVMPALGRQLFALRPWDGDEVLAAPLALTTCFGLLCCAAEDRPFRGRFRWLALVFADQRESHVAFTCAVLLGCAGVAALRGWSSGTSLAVLVYFVYFAGVVSLLQSATPMRGPEGFLVMLAVLVFATYVGTLVYELPARGQGMDYPPAVTVLLPTVWLGYGEFMRPISALPLVSGTLALFVARWRRRRLLA